MKKHIYYFDYLRILSAIGVVFMHVAVGGIREPISANWHITNIFVSLSFTAVPLFFMMSGYLLISSEKTNDIKVLLKQRLPKLIIPLISWTVLAALWLNSYNGNYTSFSIGGFFNLLLYAFKNPIFVYLWFMYTMIAIYMISPFIAAAVRSLNKQNRTYLVGLILVILILSMLIVIVPEPFNKFFDFSVINQLELFGGHLSAFILGYFLGSTKRKFSNKCLLAVIAGLLITIVVGTIYKTNQIGEYNAAFQVQSVGFEVFLASAIFLYFKQNFNKESRLKGVVKSFSSTTFPVYMMHGAFLSFMGTVRPIPTSFIGILGAVFVNLSACYLTVKLFGSFKLTSYAFTGIPFEEAKKTFNIQNTIARVKKYFKR